MSTMRNDNCRVAFRVGEFGVAQVVGEAFGDDEVKQTFEDEVGEAWEEIG